MIELTSKDEAQLREKGVTKERVLQQIETFKEGIPFVQLRKAAVVDGGITRLSEEKQKELTHSYQPAGRNAMKRKEAILDMMST